MIDKPSEFRQKLFEAQEMTPELRDAYHKEIDQILHPTLTPRKAILGIVLLIALLASTAGIVRTMLFYRPGPLIFGGWVVLAVAFLSASYLIVRELWRGKYSPIAALSIASSLGCAAAVLTVVAIIHGLGNSSDPKATFDAFYAFVFYFACFAWALESRIAAAELAAREQMLRIEYRLADLAEKLQK